MGQLEFEKPIYDLEKKIRELKEFNSEEDVNLNSEIEKLERKLKDMSEKIYKNLTSWQRVMIARHPDRPYSLDYIRMMMTDFVELHGDRLFADDLAIVAGLAKLDNQNVLVIGQQKGRDLQDNLRRNFGCAHPEGYRKAIRFMKMAEKFGLPVIIFIDTPGAYPGIGAEERGQAQAIAENLKEMAQVATPIIATVIGEGGSGGALGVGVADIVCMLEHSYYSVISPEGCASILWRNSVKAPEAAEALKITSENLLKFGVIEEVIPEPLGGVHRNLVFVVNQLKKTLLKYVREISALSEEELLQRRYDRFRKLGHYQEDKLKDVDPVVVPDQNGKSPENQNNK